MYQEHGILARILGLQSKGRRRKESLKKSKERRLTLESLEQRRLLSASGLIARPLPQVVIPQGTSAQFISLASAFHEADGSRPPLNYTVLNNTNPQLFTVLPVDASSGRLLLQVPPDVSGTAEITVQATDPYGQSADATVEVAVAGDSGISDGDTNLLNGQSLEVGTAAGLSDFSSGTLGIARRSDFSGSGGSGGSGGGSASGGGGGSGGSGGLDTWTDLYSWPSVAAPGAPVDMVAVVTDQNGEPITAGEGVEFAYVGANPFALGWGTTDDSGDAYLTTTSLPAGDDPIQAGYPGDGYYSPSVSYTNDVAITGVAITNLPPNNSLAEGASVALSGSFLDADGHPATPDRYSWTISDDSGDTIDTGSAANYTFTPATSGTFTVSVTAILNGVPSTDTRTLVATNVAPDWTSGSIVGAKADVGQTYNLPAVTFHDAGPGSWHTSSVNWGDGAVTQSELDEAQTNANNPAQGMDGTIFDSHAYAATGPHTATITLTDDAGASITKTFQITAVNSQVALTRFAPSPDNSQLQVQYTVATANSAPFNLGIYASSDGSSPDQLLTSYAVGGVYSSELTAGAHTVYIPANYADPQQDYHLIAVSDASSTNNTLEFAGGVFQASDTTQDSPQPYLCAFGTAANGAGPGDTVTVGPTTIVFDGQPSYTVPSGTSSIHIRGEYGDNIVGADPSEIANVTTPLWLFGGPGNNTLIGGARNDVIVDGSGQNIIHGGNGFNSPEIVHNSDNTAAFPGLANCYTEAGGGWSSDTDASALHSAYNGDQELGPEVTGSSATWTFASLTPGAYYDVYATWSPESGASTAAQYSVADGATAVQPIGQIAIPTVDQTQPPLDDQATGVYWRHMGVFQCNSGVLNVSLASDGSGYVLAGAVRLVQEPAVPATGLTMDGFSLDANGLPAVTYTITGTPGVDCAPFSIGIYQSSDGLHTDNLVDAISVGGENDLAGHDDLSPGTHTVESTDGLSGLDGANYCIAKLDCNNEVVETSRNDNISAPLTGMFEQDDGTVFVLGSATWIANDSVIVTQDSRSGDVTISLANESVSQVFSEVTSVTISTPGGGNSIDVDPSVTAPVSVFGGAGSNVSGQVANSPEVSLEADLPTVAESGGQTGEFIFLADNTEYGAVTAYFQIDSSSTAWLDYNYTISGATAVGYNTYAVTIPTNTGEATVEITPIDTGAVGGSETVVLDVIAGNDYNVETDSSTATVTLFNNDLPNASIVADEPNATESGVPGEFTVSLSAPVSEPLLVNYTIDGTAVNGQDYQTIAGNVVIPAHSSTATIAVDPLDAGLTSGSTSVVLTLAAGSGYVIPDPAPSDTVTIDDSSDSQAPAAREFYIGTGGTYAIPPGATKLYLGFHDIWHWDDNLGAVSAEVSWNVAGGDTYSVPATACVDFAFAPSGVPGPNYGEDNVDDFRPIEVYVPAGATSVTISASGTWGYQADDPGYGPDGSTDYSGPTNPEYRAAYLHSENIIPDSCNLASLEGMWTPVSSPSPTLAVGNAVAVAGDTETFTVTLSQKVGYTVSVPYHTQNGSAVAVTDYTAASGTLTFSPGQVIQTVTVPTKLDPDATGDLNFTVALGTPSGGTLNGAGSTGTATIEQVTGTLTIYNPDGPPSVDGTVGVGESAPMTVRLTSPAAVDGTFTLSYDTDYFEVTTDAAGDDVVTPGVTPITPSTGGTRLYLWGGAPPSDPAGSQITLKFVWI